MKFSMGEIKKQAKDIFDQMESTVRNEIDDERNPKAAIRRVILVYSSAAAAANLNPLPFSGFVMLTPIHVAMVLHVGKRMGHELNIERAGHVFKQILGAVGLSLATRMATGALLKIGLPGIGGTLRAPAVFAMTYGLGRVAEEYFERKNEGLDFDTNAAKEVFARAVEEGKVEGGFAESFRAKVKKEQAKAAKKAEAEKAKKAPKKAPPKPAPKAEKKPAAKKPAAKKSAAKKKAPAKKS